MGGDLKYFLVTKIERWEQLVQVEAKDKTEALDKAKEGDYTIHTDPEYHSDCNPDLWNIEEMLPEEE